MTLLLIEDDWEFYSLFCEYLSVCGHKVIAPVSVEEVMEATDRHKFDAVLLSETFPGREKLFSFLAQRIVPLIILCKGERTGEAGAYRIDKSDLMPDILVKIRGIIEGICR
jgi:DNA-binding response OmpR family regulator